MTPKKKRSYAKIHPIHKKRLRDLSEKRGQKWVAERLGVGPSAVSRILLPGETGVYPKTLEAIVKLVGKNGVEAESAPARARHAARRADAGGNISEAFAAMSKLDSGERKRVLDAIAIIEGG